MGKVAIIAQYKPREKLQDDWETGRGSQIPSNKLPVR